MCVCVCVCVCVLCVRVSVCVCVPAIEHDKVHPLPCIVRFEVSFSLADKANEQAHCPV